jgi:hypothetical protein
VRSACRFIGDKNEKSVQFSMHSTVDKNTRPAVRTYSDLLCLNASNEEVGSMIDYLLTRFERGLLAAFAWCQASIRWKDE